MFTATQYGNHYFVHISGEFTPRIDIAYIKGCFLILRVFPQSYEVLKKYGNLYTDGYLLRDLGEE